MNKKGGCVENNTDRVREKKGIWWSTYISKTNVFSGVSQNNTQVCILICVGDKECYIL